MMHHWAQTVPPGSPLLSPAVGRHIHLQARATIVASSIDVDVKEVYYYCCCVITSCEASDAAVAPTTRAPTPSIPATFIYR